MKYVNVVIDNNTDQTDNLYTYGCPFAVQVGSKVRVPFARGNRLKDGYVFEVLDELPAPVKNLKQVAEVDPDISLTEEAVATCIWMRGRYFCRYIDAINCFTPAGSSSKRGKKRNPFKDAIREELPEKALTAEQQEALSELSHSIAQNQHQVFLIHGVTSSGKTEVYIQAIEECVKRGKSAIMLVPEISLTTQTVQRFINYFGTEAVAILHSKLSLGERYDEWMRLKKGEVKIVVGARSAIFAPVSDIGIIILDEEHETTYKSDMTPKYDTTEVAVKRAMAENAIVVLGSATPSLPSYYRAEQGMFQLIELKKRFNEAPLPQVSVVDMRQELKSGNKSVFSRSLMQEMERCLTEKRQIILFLNRRGYSTFISCRTCGYVVKCPDCGISLTYHKGSNAAVCHFCGRKQAVPRVCPDCQGQYIRHFGSGTEKIEEQIAEIFPAAQVARLDLDAVKKKGSIDTILKSFQRGKTDILIGTQLVAKGLDFANVGLVGIISADVTLNIPDFRSAERTFQLVTQAAGRAGRGELPGQVVIQTYTPDHYAITAASGHDYHSFYKQELYLRRQISYPPFADFIQLVVSAETMAAAEQQALRTAEALKERWDARDGYVMGPQLAVVNKQSGLYRYQILIKALAGSRKKYAATIAEVKKQVFVDTKSECKLSIDVNPYSFM